ncbi:MAG: hypothetical protein AAF171_15790 [Cyanobacteria bacterium P01_A01_bin.116]
MKQQRLKNNWVKKWLLGSLLSATLLLASAHTANAQILAADTGEFRRIEQPLSLKVGVAGAGAGLMGLELWWFLFRK